MDLNLSSKKVLITGGTRGIGLACAESFLREGAEVSIVGSSTRSVDHACDHLFKCYGVKTLGITLNLADYQGQLSLAQHLESVDVLINNAGAIPGGGLESLNDERWRAAWDLKVHGYIDATRHALKIMSERKSGVIINVIGIAGVRPRYDYLCGSAGNAALVSFTQAAGAESTKYGVRVLGINPGPTETDRVKNLYMARAKQRLGDESRWQELLSDLPFGRPARPEEIADVIVFMASERASYLSGVVLDADGGARFSA
ncbi:SDR family NAD(P)-dependent oxidoreductase [Pseudomonas moorei]|nr:SDR family NAD(P)-dependent oxidoreductase [Pseudomonas moorei]